MSGENILVVEDNRTTASIMQLKLENLGYKVPSLARNADEAIEKAGSFKPNLILMDIKLGKGRDGIEAAGIIKERYKIPVVFVTSHSDEQTLARAKNIHPLGYINKPLRDKDLKVTIELALEKLREAKQKSSAAGVFDSAPEIKVELTCAADGTVTDFNPAANNALKELGLSSIDELLPYNHRQINNYCLRIGNSYLIAGRLLDYIFSWEYIPNPITKTVRVICENLANKRKLSESHSNEDAFKQTLNFLSLGVMLVDQNLQPTFINQAADSLLKQDIGLCLKDDTLVLDDTELQEELEEMIKTGKNGKITAIKPGHSPTELLISPTKTTGSEQFSTSPTAIIFLFHGHKDTEGLEEILTALYGFTKAEARLASALVQDPRLEEAAKSIGIKINTARTHLKKIFQKTGTDRQSSLVHHIVSGPAGILIKSGTL